MTELPAAFIAALEAQREALNNRFAERQRGGTRIDGTGFLRHLEHAVAPLVAQVHAALPERTASVVAALHDVSLDLFSASLLGPNARMSWVRRVWTELLPAVPLLLAREPQQVAGCLCNAVFQIASQPGARPEQWLVRMQPVAPHCQTVSELLEVGKVAAWLAGMVQFRQPALTAAGNLRAGLAAQALGMPDSTSTPEITAMISRLRNHVWLSVEAAASNQVKSAIACVGTAGAFSGFGGLFMRPPIVNSDGQRLWVSDGGSQWELLADAYGSWFRREEVLASRMKSAPKTDASIDRHGTIHWRKQSLAQPHLAQPSSLARSGQTLAVTIPTSHHVFLYSSLGGAA